MDALAFFGAAFLIIGSLVALLVLVPALVLIKLRMPRVGLGVSVLTAAAILLDYSYNFPSLRYPHRVLAFPADNVGMPFTIAASTIAIVLSLRALRPLYTSKDGHAGLDNQGHLNG